MKTARYLTFLGTLAFLFLLSQTLSEFFHQLLTDPSFKNWLVISVSLFWGTAHHLGYFHRNKPCAVLAALGHIGMALFLLTLIFVVSPGDSIGAILRVTLPIALFAMLPPALGLLLVWFVFSSREESPDNPPKKRTRLFFLLGTTLLFSLIYPFSLLLIWLKYRRLSIRYKLAFTVAASALYTIIFIFGPEPVASQHSKPQTPPAAQSSSVTK